MSDSISPIVVCQVVVDDHVIGEVAPDRLFDLGLLQPGEHLVVRVAATAQATLLFGPGRRQDEEQHRIGVPLLDLLGAVDLDLEHDVARPA